MYQSRCRELYHPQKRTSRENNAIYGVNKRSLESEFLGSFAEFYRFFIVESVSAISFKKERIVVEILAVV